MDGWVQKEVNDLVEWDVVGRKEDQVEKRRRRFK